MNPQRIFNVLDRLAHHSTAGSDLILTVAAMRRLLTDGDGVVAIPSEVLPDVLRGGPPEPTPRKRKSADAALQAEIADLREKLRRAESQKGDQTCQIAALVEQIARLQIQLDGQTSDDAPIDGFYTRAQVKRIIATLFKKDHGVYKALVEKNAEQRRSGISMPKITDSLLQQFQRRDQYPVWVIEQLKLLTPDDLLRGHRWTPENKDFVVSLWRSNPQLTNEQLAETCSRQFGAKITDSAIRGVLNRAGLLRPAKGAGAPAPHTSDRAQSA